MLLYGFALSNTPTNGKCHDNLNLFSSDMKMNPVALEVRLSYHLKEQQMNVICDNIRTGMHTVGYVLATAWVSAVIFIVIAWIFGRYFFLDCIPHCNSNIGFIIGDDRTHYRRWSIWIMKMRPNLLPEKDWKTLMHGLWFSFYHCHCQLRFSLVERKSQFPCCFCALLRNRSKFEDVDLVWSLTLGHHTLHRGEH